MESVTSCPGPGELSEANVSLAPQAYKQHQCTTKLRTCAKEGTFVNIPWQKVTSGLVPLSQMIVQLVVGSVICAYQKLWPNLSPVLQAYKLQNNMAVYSLGPCICSGVLGGTTGSKEPEDEVIEDEGVQVTALQDMWCQQQLQQCAPSCILASRPMLSGPHVCYIVYPAADRVVQQLRHFRYHMLAKGKRRWGGVPGVGCSIGHKGTDSMSWNWSSCKVIHFAKFALRYWEPEWFGDIYFCRSNSCRRNTAFRKYTDSDDRMGVGGFCSILHFTLLSMDLWPSSPVDVAYSNPLKMIVRLKIYIKKHFVGEVVDNNYVAHHTPNHNNLTQYSTE